METLRKNKLLTMIATIVFLFLFLPLVIIVITSFGTEAIITFPIKGFTIDWYIMALTSKAFMSSLQLSLLVGVVATLLALVIGVPAAYVLSRDHFKGKKLMKDFFLSPTMIPGIVVGYSLYQMIVVSFKFPILPGLLIGHFLISIPYVIRVVGSSMEQVDVSMEEAAWTLGCTKKRAFAMVLLPNITSGIFAAFMLSFVNSFNNVPVSMFLSGPGVTMLPTTLLSYMEFNYDPSVSALSVILMFVTMGIMIAIEKTLGLASIS